MSALPKRRLLDRIGSSSSLLALDTRVIGDIETGGALLLNGSVRGNGRIGGDLVIAAGAHWEGELRARCAVVAGRINGSLIVSEKLEISATAHIRGRVTASQIAVARGAIIDGEIVVTSGEPVLEFEEKRTAGPV